MSGTWRAIAGAALLATSSAHAQVAAIEAAPLPPSATRVAASADECAVWRREEGFSRSVERHDAQAFESFLHAGTIFDAGSPEAARGRDAVVKAWAGIVEGKDIALRWRAGIVQIGGEPAIALSRGPYILQRIQAGVPVFRVGTFQTIWVRDARDGIWRILFDGSAGAPQPMADRAAAERWVEAQPMSDCAP